MIIGSRERLAMEYEIVPPIENHILGHFCMWIGGHMVGDLSDKFVLTVAQGGIEESLECSEQRFDPTLFAMEKDEAMRFLQDALYGEKAIDEQARTWSRYRAFNLKHFLISSTQNLWLFLIAGATAQRMLWRREDQQDVMEMKLPAGTYEAVARDFLRSFEDAINVARRKFH